MGFRCSNASGGHVVLVTFARRPLSPLKTKSSFRTKFMAKHASIAHLDPNTRKNTENMLFQNLRVFQRCFHAKSAREWQKRTMLVIITKHLIRMDRIKFFGDGRFPSLSQRNNVLEHGNSKCVTHPPSQALCTYSLLTNVIS